MLTLNINQNNLKQISILFLLVCLSGALFAQKGDIPDDLKTRELLSLGKRYLRTENYTGAVESFELAISRDFNRLTTTCIYLAGISNYKVGNGERAKIHFNRIIHNYPDSKYAEDAKYHKALLLLKSKDNSLKELGLDLMFDLTIKAKNKTIRGEALDAARNFLFSVFDKQFVEVYYLFAHENFRTYVLEAVCYHLIQNDEEHIAQSKIKAFEEGGGTLTRYLSALKRGNVNQKETTPESEGSKEVRIAIMLPFLTYLGDTSLKVPKDSERALELYEGMKMAANDYVTGSGKNKSVRIKVYDTRKDTVIIAKQLTDLGTFLPDIIIGDISSRANQPISAWAEAHKVAQFIPLNPSEKLVEGKTNIFLTHPSLVTHGSSLADFAYKKMGHKAVVIFYDSSPVSTTMSEAFEKKIDSLGGRVIKKKISWDFGANEKLIPEMVRSLRSQVFDAVYIPVAQEENAGLIISQLNYYGISTQVLGSPDWSTFSAIDEEQKTRFKLTYTTVFYENNDSIGSQDLKIRYLESFNNFPNPHVLQGYDIMAYILKTSTIYDPYLPFELLISEQKVYHGLSQDIFFNEHQDNQKTNIVQHKDGRVFKINYDPTQ